MRIEYLPLLALSSRHTSTHMRLQFQLFERVNLSLTLIDSSSSAKACMGKATSALLDVVAASQRRRCNTAPRLMACC